MKEFVPEEQFTLCVTLEIYGPGNQNLRLTERTPLTRGMSLEEAAKVLTAFSTLAQEIRRRMP
jgi:hypothetical protein